MRWQKPPRHALYDVAREITDEILGEGSYAEMNKGNPDPQIQAAIKRSQQKGSDMSVNHPDMPWKDKAQALEQELLELKGAEKPHLIERMENLIAALDIAAEKIGNEGDSAEVTPDLDNALGIAGEILTMIDGR